MTARPDGGSLPPPGPARRFGEPAGADVIWGIIKLRTPRTGSGTHVRRARPVSTSDAPTGRGGTRS